MPRRLSVIGCTPSACGATIKVRGHVASAGMLLLGAAVASSRIFPFVGQGSCHPSPANWSTTSLLREDCLPQCAPDGNEHFFQPENESRGVDDLPGRFGISSEINDMQRARRFVTRLQQARLSRRARAKQEEPSTAHHTICPARAPSDNSCRGLPAVVT